jgi:hypothetical protein
LARLVAQGLITQTPIMLAKGHASEVTIYQVQFGSDEWLALAPVVAKVQLPDRANRPRARRVPPHLLDLFWNTAPAQPHAQAARVADGSLDLAVCWVGTQDLEE